jgi:acetyl-CoA carboxylase carboxyl transferase subunit alpha
MKKLGIVDGVIKEPLNGAHRDHETTFKSVKSAIKKNLTELKKMKPEDRIEERIEAFSKRGVWK